MNTTTNKQQTNNKVTTLLPTQHNFNMLVSKEIKYHNKQLTITRTLIAILIISQLAITAWTINTINTTRENSLNQQIINQESIPSNLQPIPVNELM